MLSKRKEHFRFSPGTPFTAVFRIVKIGEQPETEHVKSSSGEAAILDISPAGLKIQTVFNIPLKKSLFLELTFVINDKSFTLKGDIQWQKKAIDGFQYGIKLDMTTDLKQQVIDELKKYSKKVHRK